MAVATIAKNGTINFPVTIRKTLGVDIGDKVSFVIRDDEVIIIPIHKLEELITPEKYEQAVQIIEELHKEHQQETW